jgi:acyl transferase domain-containing protein/NADP-dependent 3-hydroxy acid dehydrogenase YdfG
MRRRLEQVSALDTRTFGDSFGQPCRVLVRPGFSNAEAVKAASDRAEAESLDAASWRQAAKGAVGWGPPEEQAWPIGQTIGFAKIFAKRYKTTGRAVRKILEESARSLTLAEQLNPLGEEGPLAESHGTRYPIVQGPMTRVSDSAAFADAVSGAGALPFLALALMSGEQSLTLLKETAELLGERPWGVGLLGFTPQELRKKQIEAIWQVRPRFALIAGGRPDQAAAFEEQGIATYIHVPTAELLGMFLDQGARRFVFEGRECGGHIGPLSSFVLWESQIELLLDRVPEAEASKVHVLFAGGIHDGRSSAMVSAMAARLAERGIKVGVLLGSAYLFTEEIVSTGAIVPEFQTQALACRHTLNLETGPGHVTRCADTNFGQEFFATRRQLIQKGTPGEEIREQLEDLNLGRLRMASKGKRRDPEKGITDIDVEEQLRDGMYMIGQVATLRDEVVSLADLHREVSDGAAAYLAARHSRVEASAAAARPSDIAIVGIGTLLPGACDPETYWANLISKSSPIGEIPRERWDWRLYFDEDRTARDKVYSKWGGFLEEVPIDPMRFGIPPKSFRSIDPLQLLTLEAVRRAVEDAGYGDGDFDRENTSVILGAGGGLGDLGMQYGVRSEVRRFVGEAADGAMDRLPEWTEESFAGSLLNVAAGRVANRFNFGGLNFTVDAACAASLAAVNLAVNELESGRSSVALAGGIDTIQSPFAYLCFSKTQALSPKGKARTFDKGADGIVISEGIAVLMLKRLADAEQAGDRIYAVIKSVGGSSDGRALGLTAPLPEGQMRALRRAYAKAGVSPASLDLIEAHGTGTTVGDRAEVETIVRTLNASGAAPRSCAIGSVKTLIGHTKAAAGVAGLTKIALALHHKVLPPHEGVESPLDMIADPESPVYLLKQATPWLASPGRPRRAAASSFGFGGTNFHTVVEEYNGAYRPGERVAGGLQWPSELFVFKGVDDSALEEQLRAVKSALDDGAAPRPRDLAYSLALQSDALAADAATACIVAGDLGQLRQCLDSALTALTDDAATLPPHIVVRRKGQRQGGKIAFLFPGQGSQYVNMARESALYLDPLRKALEQADAVLAKSFETPLKRLIYPEATFNSDDEKRQHRNLTDTKVAQPAIGAISAGMLDLAGQLGLVADMVAGHSYGEFSALHAAGCFARDTFFTLSAARGEALAEACNAPQRGTMGAVRGELRQVEEIIAEEENVVVANHNAPLQVVISGEAGAVGRALEKLNGAGLSAQELPVAGAFHSSLMVPCKPRLDSALATARLSKPSIPVYSNTTGKPYPDACEAIRKQLADHLLGTVQFVSQIEEMHAAGARIFIELGPKSVLTSLVGQILGERDHLAVTLDSGGGLRGLLSAVGTLAANGVGLRASALFDNREVTAIDLARLTQLYCPAKLSASTWYVSGGCARAAQEPLRKTGTNPALTLETLEEARPPQPVAAPEPAATFTNGAGSAPQPAALAGADAVGVAATNAMPSIGVPASAVPTAGAPGMDANSLGALQAYQETMRQFLGLQEQVMARFLALDGQQPAMAPAAFQAPAESYAETPAALNPGILTNGSGGAPVTPETVTLEPAATPEPAVTPASGTTSDAALNAEELRALVTDLMSERTGYPPDMLSGELDMEAELGIDSIKRVEILGAIQQRLPAGIAAQVKAEMENLTRVKTVDGLVDALARTAPADVPAATAPPPAGAPDQPAPGGAQIPDAEELRALATELVSERTGYPAEMLDGGLDMEAELGIDSIKRVEILGALQQRLPAALAACVKEEMESLTRVKSLDSLISALLQAGSASTAGAEDSAATAAPPKVPPQPEPDPAAAESTAPQSPAKEPQGVPRLIMAEQEAPLAAQDAALTGTYVVTESGDDAAAAVARAIEAAGAETRLIAPTALDEEGLQAAVEEAAGAAGRLAGVVHVMPLGAESRPESFGDWREACRADVKSLYRLLHSCAPLLTGKNRGERAQILAVSAMGGRFGRDDAGPLARPSQGGALGLIKCVAGEWPGAVVRGLDVDPQTTPDELAALVVAELAVSGEDKEIGYHDGRRFAFRPATSALESTGGPLVEPSGDWVTLITGGARGITAEIACSLARPGMQIVIVGRTPEPGPEPSETSDCPDMAALRRRLSEQAKAAGEPATPVEIERTAARVLAAREVRRNLERLQEAGAKLHYRAADVRDEAAFGTVINWTYENLGRLDAVIHGAGLIEDRLLLDKTPDSFDRVFDTKADSTYLLTQLLRGDDLKAVVLFSSVAGRFGNAGQSDYAAANEVVNRMAWQMHANWPEARIVSISWGPWDAPGMASEAIKQKFRERGIIPIPVGQGCAFALEELRRGTRGDVEIIAGAGPWLAEASATPAQHGSLLALKPATQTDGTVMVEEIFDLHSHPYLADHCLDGVPVLPATAALEWLGQLVRAAWPDWILHGFQNFRVLKGVRLQDKTSRHVLLRAKASSHADAGSLQVKVELLDPETGAIYYNGTAQLVARLPDLLDSSFEPITVGEQLDADTAYRKYLFHGDLFHLVTEIQRIGPSGVDAIVRPCNAVDWLNGQLTEYTSTTGKVGPWLFDPGLLDTAPQLAIVWSRMIHNTTPLPTFFKSVMRYGAAEIDGPLQLRLRVSPNTSDHMTTYDAEFLDSSGKVHFRMEAAEGVGNKSLNRLSGH